MPIFGTVTEQDFRKKIANYTSYGNIEIQFFLGQTTSYLQPEFIYRYNMISRSQIQTVISKLWKSLDHLQFACLKARYRAWLAKRKLNGNLMVEKFYKSPHFLEKCCFAKSKKSWFFGKGLFAENAKVLFFWFPLFKQTGVFGRSLRSSLFLGNR